MEELRSRFFKDQTGKILRNADVMLRQNVKDFADEGSSCVDQRVFLQEIFVLQPRSELLGRTVGIPRDSAVFAQSPPDCRIGGICRPIFRIWKIPEIGKEQNVFVPVFSSEFRHGVGLLFRIQQDGVVRSFL